jgi:DNA-binding response OmpR family regulator
VGLMDVNMPEIDGFALAAMIREHPRYQQTAILFISGVHLTDRDMLKGYEYGAVDYMTVPIIPALLRAKVRVFVDLYRKTVAVQRLERDAQRSQHVLLLGRLAASVSHEIRNPLSAITLHVELLQEEMRQPSLHSAEVIAESFTEITSQLARLHVVVKEKRTLS